MKNTKTWRVDEDYAPLTMKEMVENVTYECARRLMNDEDFKTFCELREEWEKERRLAIEEYSRTHYFPGCYGDALTDC